MKAKFGPGTTRGILRRGMAVAPLCEIIQKQEPSRNILNLEWGAFWALNKKYIDPEASPHTAIVQDHAVHCSIRGFDGPEAELKPK
jgi:glutamyl-tRNA synthetase